MPALDPLGLFPEKQPPPLISQNDPLGLFPEKKKDPLGLFVSEPKTDPLGLFPEKQPSAPPPQPGELTPPPAVPPTPETPPLIRALLNVSGQRTDLTQPKPRPFIPPKEAKEEIARQKAPIPVFKEPTGRQDAIQPVSNWNDWFEAATPMLIYGWRGTEPIIKGETWPRKLKPETPKQKIARERLEDIEARLVVPSPAKVAGVAAKTVTGLTGLYLIGSMLIELGANLPYTANLVNKLGDMVRKKQITDPERTLGQLARSDKWIKEQLIKQRIVPENPITEAAKAYIPAPGAQPPAPPLSLVSGREKIIGDLPPALQGLSETELIQRINDVRQKVSASIEASKAVLQRTGIIEKRAGRLVVDSDLPLYKAMAKADAAKAAEMPTLDNLEKQWKQPLPSATIIGEEAGIVKIPTPEPKVEPYSFAPEIEQRYKMAKGVPKETVIQKTKNLLTTLKNRTLREYEHLPKTKENAQLRSDLLKLSKQKGVSSDKAVRIIRTATEELDPNAFDLFARKVLVSDLLETAKEGKSLPFGFTPETLSKENIKLEAEISKYPSVMEALPKRSELVGAVLKDYIKAMKRVGFDVSEILTRKNYFRHKVLDYAQAKSLFGTGRKLRTPTGRGFLKKRVGSELDINVDYIQVEHEVLAQMIHDIQQADTLYKIGLPVNKGGQNIRDRVDAQAKRRNLDDWHKAIPEGYTTWQPREGNVFYFGETIPANLAEKLMTGELKEIGLTKEQLNRVLAVGRRRKEYVVRQEVADTLDNLTIRHSESAIMGLDREALKAWKAWTLVSPRRYGRYNIRNMTGDAEWLFIGNPKAFRNVPSAISELWEGFVKGGEIAPELQAWLDRGGLESTLQAQEIGELNRLEAFRNIQAKKFKLKGIPLSVWKKYWRVARISTDFRESILRYAAFKNYRNQMLANPEGMPDNFGASIPEEIMGLNNIDDRAYFLSNDLLGAYDRIGVTGQALRQYWLPFWSFQETNMRRYVQTFKNAANSGHIAEMVGRKALGTLAKTPFTAWRIGKFLLMATGFWSALQAWNHFMFPELERDLPEDVRSRPHMIFGKNEDGTVNHFTRIGVLGDFLEWFGLEQFPKQMDDWLGGRKNLKEIAKDMAVSPVNKSAQMLTPFVKLPAELITRQKLFPDIFNRGIVRDKGFHVAWSLGLGDEYALIFNKPTKGYVKSLSKLVMYQSTPLESAYFDILKAKKRFLKQKERWSEGYHWNQRSAALYDYKLALRYKDKKAADAALQNYYALGGNIRGARQSLNMMNPLFGLRRRDREHEEFRQWLGEDGSRRLDMAIQYYDETLKDKYLPER